ncbi:C4b-binding protein alpha chain-like isoform X3 [Micropterus dolomieu]|uniref:C4b-binding protein alpha chain-like isoform X3 n=1 Tax=Micropterus dolomieu TaxID=147949 RepID=UPI001E8DB119|nr:C4b-binding protein alpha chain-like isoform X3 [Micropterus dolomieu]
MGVTYFLLLSCIGLAITVQAQDCSKPLAGPNMDLKGSDNLLQTFPNGTKVSFACDPGYVSAGGSAVITCNAGTWTPVRLKCEKRNCGSAGEVNNGHIDYPTGTDFGDYTVITCNEGYRFVGNSKILCGVLGWDGRLPECEVVTCYPPPTVEQGTFSPVEDVYEYRETVKYSCQSDYTLNGSITISCSDDGTFVPDPPKCVKVQCGDPAIENANWVDGSRPPYGYKATVKYQCNPGYVMTGQSTVTCDINSQWSPGLPYCNKTINCGSAVKVENGRVEYPKGTDYGSEAVISCNTGYRLVGKSKILCGVQGWDGSLPVCEVVTCDPPPVVEQGTFSPKKETYKFKDVVQYSCQNNYTLDGSMSLSCSEDGTFVPAPPKCIKVQCGDPVIKNAKWVKGSRPPYGYKATVTYQCISGYFMTGPSTLTCEMNSQWSPGLPECQKEGHCGEPVIENAKWVEGSRPPYGYNAKVTYQCISGYVMTGPSTLTCEMNSQWSPGLPVCQKGNNSNVLGITLGVLGALGETILARGIQKKERE